MTNKSVLPSLWGRASEAANSFADLHREVDRVFRDFGRGAWPAVFSGGNGEVVPQIDISETDDAFEVTAELPGVDEKDIDVSLSDNILTIKGEKKSEREEKEDDYHLTERSFGRFQRSFKTPDTVDEEKVQANLKDGVLHVTLPKRPDAVKAEKKIPIGSN